MDLIVLNSPPEIESRLVHGDFLISFISTRNLNLNLQGSSPPVKLPSLYKVYWWVLILYKYSRFEVLPNLYYWENILNWYTVASQIFPCVWFINSNGICISNSHWLQKIVATSNRPRYPVSFCDHQKWRHTYICSERLKFETSFATDHNASALHNDSKSFSGKFSV